jgi:hypothetical protein
MRHKTFACPRVAAFHSVYRRTRFARLFLFLVLCCLSITWSFAASSAAPIAAADCTTPGFSPPTLYDVQGAIRSLAYDDFDGDGNSDVMILTNSATGNLSLFLGDGTGAFPHRAFFSDAKGHSPMAIASGDFDSDGLPDIVISNGTSVKGIASVYLNNGLLFDREIPILSLDTSVITSSDSVVVADFNGDGKPDIALTASGLSGLSVVLGDGAGNFSNHKRFPSGSRTPIDMVASDFNGDGKIDLAVLNTGLGSNAVLILLGDGTGSFSASSSARAGQLPSSITPGDFNSDNKIDLAVDSALAGTQSISLLFGNGAGAFSAPSSVNVGGATGRLAVADFNGDGKTDIVAGRPPAHLSILLGDGTGNFNLIASPVAGGPAPFSIIARDPNGDGKPDLLGTGSGISGESALSVLLNGCGATTASLSFNTTAHTVSETANTVTVTVIRSGSLSGSVSVNYATNDNTASSPSDYKATAGTLTFADGEASKTINVEIVNDTVDEQTQAFLVSLSNPTGTAVLGTHNFTRVNINDDDPTFSFSVNNATVTEGAGRATITITRTSDESGTASLNYNTEDTDNFTVGCADTTNNQVFAYARCDFATTSGKLDFAAGESQKTFTIPIIDDGHDESAETFRVVVSNPEITGTGTVSEASVTITDNDEAGARNPINTTAPADYPFFVRQQYLDFLSREPEPDEPWTAVMNRCPNVHTPPSAITDCDRIAVSGAVFRSPENRMKGFYVFRFYKVAFNRLPEYREIVADMSFVAGATEAEVYARKAQLATAFAARGEFLDHYDLMTNAQFVPALLARYQLASVTTPDPAAPDGAAKVTLSGNALLNGLDAGTLTRAQVLRAIADSNEVATAEYNSAFVAAQYYGYLRRTPEDSGYQAWLRVINQDPNNIRIMVNGFMNSTEYRLRFGQP